MREQTFAEREAEVNRQLAKQQAEANRWAAFWETPREIVKPAAAPQTVAATKIPAQAASKPVIGDKAERTDARIEKRCKQSLAVLKAFIEAQSSGGLTDNELSARQIGGSDGPRRRRDCRLKLGIDFNKREDKGVSRWSLTDLDHAKRTLAAGRAVEQEQTI